MIKTSHLQAGQSPRYVRIDTRCTILIDFNMSWLYDSNFLNTVK